MHLDTHVVAWLYAGEVDRFPAGARQRIETEPLEVSPIVILELQYLFETGKITEPPAAVITDLERRVGLREVEAELAALINIAVGRSWTRDPFDRLIASHATLEGEPLLTADTTILAELPEAVWD